MASAVLASIPSPDSSTIELGPLSIHFYGLTLLLAIAAAVVITGIRWTRRGGDWDLIFRCAVWGVAAGIVGARLYHVVTSWDELPDEWWGAFAIWKGGLGVWGGIGLGVIVGMIVAKRSGADVAKLADCVAPGPPRRAGHRALRELVEPGALRQADRPALGSRDLAGEPPDRVRPERDLPSHVRIRGALVLRGSAPAHRHRAALQDPSRRALRALRARLQHRAGLDRAPSRRPLARDRRGAPERLGRRPRDRRFDRVLRLVAALVEPRRAGGSSTEGGDDGRPSATAA